MEYNDLPKPASEATRQIHQAMKTLLDFDDPHEKECALRNCLKKVENLEIKNAEGEVIWSQKIACLDQEQEVETINPSLYRNAWLNHQTGLFKVVDGIFQVRGYDMSNLTVIAGETGWIVCDPLISCECSAAALALVNAVLGTRPVSAVVISHPHLDHFGGIKGIRQRRSGSKRFGSNHCARALYRLRRKRECLCDERDAAAGLLPVWNSAGFWRNRRDRDGDRDGAVARDGHVYPAYG